MRRREWLHGISLMVLAVSIGLAGCATVRTKFSRKKEKEKEKPVFYFEEFQKSPYAETYRQNYTLWKAWEGELLIALDGISSKRQMTCYLSALESLRKMREAVKEEAQANITPYIEELEKFGAIISESRLSRIQSERVKRNIERHKMTVEKKLSPPKAEPWLKKDKPYYE